MPLLTEAVFSADYMPDIELCVSMGYLYLFYSHMFLSMLVCLFVPLSYDCRYKLHAISCRCAPPSLEGSATFPGTELENWHEGPAMNRQRHFCPYL